jgi:hypothetical protein
MMVEWMPDYSWPDVGFFSVQPWHRGEIGCCAHPSRISRFLWPFQEPRMPFRRASLAQGHELVEWDANERQ